MGELCFLNCDDICMCVVNKQFQLLVYVLIPFMLTCFVMRFISLLFLGLRACVVFVVMWWSLACLLGCLRTLCGYGGFGDCDAVIVMQVCMQRECEGARVTAMLVWGTGEVWLRC